ncbi:MAG: phytanoyl-CoA dioxygenase family protein [Verrucomicrobiales bacterium]
MEPVRGGGQLEGAGFEMLPGLVRHDEIEHLRAEVARLQAGAGRVCVRDILQSSERVAGIARELAGRRCTKLSGLLPVRGILFDKTPKENWPVGWHQDLSIALQRRAEVHGYSGWTVKGGVAHVQAPVGLLERMVTLRLHLDDVPGDNGALRVVPGTHLSGKLASAEIAEHVAHGQEHICAGSAGDALLMKPLILHSSPRAGGSEAGRHRRVIHVEFAPAGALAAPLAWYEPATPNG